MHKRHLTNIASSLFGRFASHAFPSPVQKMINQSYVKLLGLDMQEFEPPENYPTLNALFTRPLRQTRRLPEQKNALISPVDALVTQTGTIMDATAYQIKGMAYDIGELVGENHRQAAQTLDGGSYANFYLSPKDYHRYHVPMDLFVRSLTHIPGKLYPVNLPFLKRKPNLFIENERIIIECEDDTGALHIIVLVGALNVGKMTVTFEPKLQDDVSKVQPRYFRYRHLPLKRGELLGWFEMGSTVLLFSQQKSVSLQITTGQKVRFGDMIGHRINLKEEK